MKVQILHYIGMQQLGPIVLVITEISCRHGPRDLLKEQVLLNVEANTPNTADI